MLSLTCHLTVYYTVVVILMMMKKCFLLPVVLLLEDLLFLKSTLCCRHPSPLGCFKVPVHGGGEVQLQADSCGLCQNTKHGLFWYANTTIDMKKDSRLRHDCNLMVEIGETVVRTCGTLQGHVSPLYVKSLLDCRC